MKHALVVAMVAACGRIGFAPAAIGSDAAAGSADAAIMPMGDLVAWYRLDEGAGVLISDDSGNNNNGYSNACGTSSPAWVAGQFGGALSFDAPMQNCVATNTDGTLALPGTWTVTAWVFLASIPPQGDAFALVAKPNAASQHNYSLWVDHGYLGAPNLGFTVAFTDAANTEWYSAVTYAVTTSTWYFLAGTWDGTALTIFIDGSAAGTTMPAAVPSATAAPAQAPLLGKNACCAQYLDGILDDVRIYNRALSSQEIATLFTMP